MKKKIRLDIDLISNELYDLLLKEFKEEAEKKYPNKDGYIWVDEIEVSSVIEFEDE